MNFHTHDLHAPMPAIINMPLEWLRNPAEASLRAEATYSVGIHPWWMAETAWEDLKEGLYFWATHPQVVRIGECGLDRLKGASLVVQEEAFLAHVSLSEQLQKPLTIHCVKAYDRLLALRKQLRPTQLWAIHGFRGKPELAQQLLAAGFDLSFGASYNEDAFHLCPPTRRYRETD
ncbi:MAG: TatD family hydrolase [Bacteroidaceae bacterium]|nr:TatD family hydrolase [Bacteroidaceae bacterium]